MARRKSSGPLTHASFEEVFVWVRDFKGMRDFYHDTLGLPIVYENPHFAELKAGAASIALHAEREGHRVGDNWFMEFRVEDIDAIVAELSRRGIRVAPISDEDFGRVTSFRDPEGNEIGLEQPPKRSR